MWEAPPFRASPPNRSSISRPAERANARHRRMCRQSRARGTSIAATAVSPAASSFDAVASARIICISSSAAATTGSAISSFATHCGPTRRSATTTRRSNGGSPSVSRAIARRTSTARRRSWRRCCEAARRAVTSTACQPTDRVNIDDVVSRRQTNWRRYFQSQPRGAAPTRVWPDGRRLRRWSGVRRGAYRVRKDRGRCTAGDARQLSLECRRVRRPGGARESGGELVRAAQRAALANRRRAARAGGCRRRDRRARGIGRSLHRAAAGGAGRRILPTQSRVSVDSDCERVARGYDSSLSIAASAPSVRHSAVSPGYCSAMRPNRVIVRAYLGRGLRLWLAVRAVGTAVLLLGHVNPIRLPVASNIQLVAFSVGVCFLETYRLRERALLGNLGVRPGALAVIFSLPAIVGEAAIRMAALVIS